eukprot:XP_001709090.1 Hypothetical protein GL50803_10830 [Giardia lamblia ATCC 50803]
MSLKQRGRNSICWLPNYGLCHSLTLALTGGEKKDLAALHDGCYPHREGLGRDLRLVVSEEARVGVDRALGQADDARPAVSRGPRLVEGDVTVVPDPQKPDVAGANCLERIFISYAFILSPYCQSAQEVYILRLYIDLAEEVLLHEEAVALVVRGRKPCILVQVERPDLREVQALLAVETGELLVDGDGGRSGRQAQNAIRLAADNFRDTVGN